VRSRRIAGLALIALGGCATLAGIVGLAVARTPKTVVSTAAGVGATAPSGHTRTTTGTRTTTAPSPAAGARGPATTVASESPEAFLNELAAAIRGGDSAFLLARLHPVVIQHFGLAACQSALRGYRDTSAKFMVISVGAPTTYAWMAGSQTIPVEGTIPVTVTSVFNGQESQAVVHIAPVDGTLRWFTTCGGSS
jgi:hypothetical protein